MIETSGKNILEICMVVKILKNFYKEFDNSYYKW